MPNSLPSQAPRTDEPGLVLGILLIGILIALLVAVLSAGDEIGKIEDGRGAVLVGLYVMTWGVMFLASYFFSHKTFFFRALIWVCEHFSAPAGRGMALFYFALAFTLGAMAVAKGLSS